MSDGHYLRKFLKVSGITDTEAIIYRISFIVNIFDWTENPLLFEGPIQHKN